MSVPFKLSSVQTEEFATIEDNFSNAKKETLSYSFNFGISEEYDSVACLGNYEIKNDDKTVIITKVLCFFDLHPDYVKKNKNDEIFILNKDLARHFAVINVGTTRGIIHTKTEDTILNELLLPTINVVDAIEDDIELNFHDPNG